jgi:hypothetical protein
MIERERELADQVAQKLKDADIASYREASLRGIQPAFIVLSRDRIFTIDVKAWEKHPGFRSRAAHQADLYRQYVGADRAFVVVDNLERSRVPEGVVTLDRLIPALQEALALTPRAEVEKRVSTSDRPHVFAAMPFDRKYDDTFFIAMRHAAESVGAVCRRVDQEEYSGHIVAEIHRLIRESIAAIIDLSESRPNVLYEAGYAHALNKPVVHICSTPLGDLPFNVAQWNTLWYAQGQVFAFKDRLAARLRAVL